MVQTKVPPPFSFYGGKHRISGKYPEPTTDVIIEPFAGSAGYSCRHGHNRQVILFDADPVLCETWQWLIDANFDDVMDLPLLDDGETVDVIESPGARNVVGFWVNKGCSKPAKRKSSWGKSVGDVSYFWGAKCRRRLAENVHHFNTWEIHNIGFENIPSEFLQTKATWFVDPPYQGKQGTHYSCGSQGIDYNQLGKFCKSLADQVIVCESSNATWLDFEPLCELSGAAKSGDGRKRSLECVWTKHV